MMWYSHGEVVLLERPVVQTPDRKYYVRLHLLCDSKCYAVCFFRVTLDCAIIYGFSIKVDMTSMLVTENLFVLFFILQTYRLYLIIKNDLLRYQISQFMIYEH